jgi:predicted nucleic acid-binding protein
MKVMFDTNVFISYIRSGHHQHHLEKRGTVKYLAATVLMELRAGAKTKSAERLLQNNLKPYIDTGRVVILRAEQFLAVGQFLARVPKEYESLIKTARFLNDVHIAFTASSIGAVLFTEDRDHFDIITGRLPSLRVEYLSPNGI